VIDYDEIVVVKLGSSSLTTTTGELDLKTVASVAMQISRLVHESKVRFVIVTSGAVAAGSNLSAELSLVPTALGMRSARAALGQPQLMNAYQAAFSKVGIAVAQLLVTGAELDLQEAYESIRETLVCFTQSRTSPSGVVVPIVNANDVVNSQIRENDDLAARIAVMVRASRLLLLTDTNGVFTRDPSNDPNAEQISDLTSQLDSFAHHADRAGRGVGSGGMRSKLFAAVVASNGGVQTTIAAARDREIIVRLLSGEPLGTVIQPRRAAPEDSKLFIGAIARTKGRVLVHRGLVEHWAKGHASSLLSVGIAEVKIDQDYGEFENGDVISLTCTALYDNRWRELGRGVVSVSSSTLRLIAGLQAEQVSKLVSIDEELIASARLEVKRAAIPILEHLHRVIVDATAKSERLDHGSVVQALDMFFPNSRSKVASVNERRLETAIRRHIDREHEYLVEDDLGAISALECAIIAPYVTADLGLASSSDGAQHMPQCLERCVRIWGGVSSHTAYVIADLLALSPAYSGIRHTALRSFIGLTPDIRAKVRTEASLLVRSLFDQDARVVRQTFSPIIRWSDMVLFPQELSAFTPK